MCNCKHVNPTEINRTPHLLKIKIHINYLQTWDLACFFLVCERAISPDSPDNNFAYFHIFNVYFV